MLSKGIRKGFKTGRNLGTYWSDGDTQKAEAGEVEGWMVRQEQSWISSMNERKNCQIESLVFDRKEFN